jgi:hypothetical protein
MAAPSPGLIIAAMALAVVLIPAIAGAQAASPQVVATAPAGPPPPAARPDSQIASVPDASGDVDDAQAQAAPKARRVRGEVSVGVGTGGYREVEGAATAPVGDTGEASVAIDASQFSAPR